MADTQFHIYSKNKLMPAAGSFRSFGYRLVSVIKIAQNAKAVGGAVFGVVGLVRDGVRGV